MAHEITSRDTMFAVGETPWHALGTVLPHGTVLTSAEAMRIAKLGWSVDRVKLCAVESQREVDRYVGLQRSDTGEILSVVSNRYAVLQNVDAFEFFDDAVARGVLRYETAGSLRGGRRVWILAALAIGPVEVAPGDTVKPYVLLANSHGDGLSVQAGLTATRVVCANTLAVALGSGLDCRERHLGDVTKRSADAFASITGLAEAMERQGDAWRTMASAPADTHDVARMLAAVLQRPMRQIVGDKDHKQAQLLDPVADAFERPRGGKMASVDGTWWGVYNALTEVLTHGARSSQTAEKRLESNAFGDGADRIARAELVCEILARRGTVTYEDLIGASESKLIAMATATAA